MTGFLCRVQYAPGGSLHHLLHVRKLCLPLLGLRPSKPSCFERVSSAMDVWASPVLTLTSTTANSFPFRSSPDILNSTGHDLFGYIALVCPFGSGWHLNSKSTENVWFWNYIVLSLHDKLYQAISGSSGYWGYFIAQTCWCLRSSKCAVERFSETVLEFSRSGKARRLCGIRYS